MKLLYKFTNPATWCVKCGFLVAIFWSILIAVTISAALYIEHLEYTAAQSENAQHLSRIHTYSIVITHIAFWFVGMTCTLGSMMMMRRSSAGYAEVESELKRERNLAQGYLDIAAVIMVVLDNDGHVKLLNRKGHEILERAGEDLTDRDWFELCVPDNDREDLQVTFKRLLAGQNVDYYENCIETKSGSKRLIAWRNATLHDSDECTGTLSSGLDITDQRATSDELRRSCDDLAEKNAELARFVYTVSHDLKSPLVTIKGYIGLMLDNISDKEYVEAHDNAMTINRAADKMQRLLDELLDLSRIGRVSSDPVCEPLNDIISDVLSGLNGLHDNNIEIIVCPDMPIVCGDRVRLGELLQNLIENAIKYSNSVERPRVEIDAWIEDNKTICRVSDNGVGIEEAYFDKIFNLFEKLDPDTPGSGVGLAVAKRIVEVHHGRIWCESAGQNKGSEFYFSIPSYC